MANKITLKAEKREVQGRKVKKLRQQGLLPANIFGRDVKSVSIQINLRDFQKIFKEAGETNIVEIDLGKESRPVLVNNIQNDPVSGQALHIDFLQVDLKKKVKAEVPVELTGVSPAEKQGLGTVVQYLNEIEVEALPAELPDKFEIDISLLEVVDQMVQIKDLKVDKNKVTIESDPESIVVKVEPPKEEKEEVVVPTETEAGTEGEGAKTTDDSEESTETGGKSKE